LPIWSISRCRRTVARVISGATPNSRSYPGLDWTKIVPYDLERMASRGERHAAEMEEVADTLRVRSAEQHRCALLSTPFIAQAGSEAATSSTTPARAAARKHSSVSASMPLIMTLRTSAPDGWAPARRRQRSWSGTSCSRLVKGKPASGCRDDRRTLRRLDGSGSADLGTGHIRLHPERGERGCDRNGLTGVAEADERNRGLPVGTILDCAPFEPVLAAPKRHLFRSATIDHGGITVCIGGLAY
jgi:hypothetical protein